MEDGILENFNQVLVDANQACIWDFDNNEFNPASWWSGLIPATACIKSDSSGSTPSISTTGLGAKTVGSVASSSSGTFVGSAKSDKYHYLHALQQRGLSQATLLRSQVLLMQGNRAMFLVVYVIRPEQGKIKRFNLLFAMHVSVAQPIQTLV